jgi:hypothetical protein
MWMTRNNEMPEIESLNELIAKYRTTDPVMDHGLGGRRDDLWERI